MTGNKSWEHFSHEADMGIRGVGSTIEEAFEMAAMGLTAVVTDPTKISANNTVTVSCQAPDLELLLVDWLNAIIYEMDTRKMLFSDFKVKIKDHYLIGEMHGELVNAAKHQPAVEIKGATYTALKLMQKDDLWYAQCVVDV